MTDTMIPPAKMLPNSRRASDSGREKYSVMISIGARNAYGWARWPK